MLSRKQRDKFLSEISKQGLHQSEWANRNGYDPAAVSRILNGKLSGRLEFSKNWEIRKAIEKVIERAQ